MFKKGQAAMEFLMTYGWAILVVLAAIGALAYFGVLSPDNLLPERTSFQAPLANVDTAVISTDGGEDQITVAIAFANNVGYQVDPTATATMTNVELDGTSVVCTAGVTGTDVAATANNENFVYTWICDTTGTTDLTDTAGAYQNKRLKADMTFTYVNAYTGQTKTHSGAVNGKVSSSVA